MDELGIGFTIGMRLVYDGWAIGMRLAGSWEGLEFGLVSPQHLQINPSHSSGAIYGLFKTVIVDNPFGEVYREGRKEREGRN